MAQVQRYDWADFMRGIMMFMVVLYLYAHTCRKQR